MKRAAYLLSIGLPLLSFVGCSSDESPPVVPNTTGGATGTAGSAGSATTAGTSTGTSGAGGSSSTAGSSSMAGSNSMAGTSTGGAAGAGGGGTGGSTAGTGGTGGMQGAVSVGKLDGLLIQTPCGDTPSTDDCNSGGWIYEGQTHACSGGQLDTDAAGTKTILDFPVTGVAGKVYVATMHFYGIMEPKNYGPNITREIMGGGRPGSGNPADPAPFAWSGPGATYSDSNYNTYEIHVIDDKGAEVKVYYLNADTQDGHYTFAIDYERPIEVIGGGKVHIRIFDKNCRQIKNCTSPGTPCAAKARSVNVSAAMPALTLTQPGLGKENEHSGQWFGLDVKNIVPK